jgi:tetratricopeptide (TPR) repeat protein
MIALQRPLLEDLPHDYKETVTTREGTVEVEFYDPLPLYLLAVADFTLAAYVLEHVERGRTARGLALLRAGRYAEAEATLRLAADGRPGSEAVVYLGEALWRLGKRSEAEEQWKGITGSLGSMVVDARSADAPNAALALAQLKSERARDLERMAGERDYGTHLARALLRSGRAAEALEVLQHVRPASVGSDLAEVRPAVLVLMARARFMVGKMPGQREHYQEARAELAAVANKFPAAGPALKLLQQVTAPPNVAGGVRS